MVPVSVLRETLDQIYRHQLETAKHWSKWRTKHQISGLDVGKLMKPPEGGMTVDHILCIYFKWREARNVFELDNT